MADYFSVATHLRLEEELGYLGEVKKIVSRVCCSCGTINTCVCLLGKELPSHIKKSSRCNPITSFKRDLHSRRFQSPTRPTSPNETSGHVRCVNGMNKSGVRHTKPRAYPRAKSSNMQHDIGTRRKHHRHIFNVGCRSI